MDVTRFLEKAEAAVRRAPDQAIALYRQVLVAEPTNAAARGGLLAAYRRRAELKNGPSLLDRAAAKSLYAAALGLRGSKRWAAVVKSCDSALEKAPADAAVVTLLAEALEALGQKEAALASWLAVLKEDAESVLALKSAGRLHYELKQVQQATECLERAHALDRHDPDVERLRRNLAAEGTLANSRYETATSSRDVLKNPQLLKRAEASSRLHRTEAERAEDLESLRSAAAAAPRDADLRRRFVKALQAAGRHAEALALLDAALQATPQDDGLSDLRGEVALAGKEAELQAARAAGDEAALERLRGEQRTLEIDEALRRVRQNPAEAAGRLRLAKILYKAGRIDEALEHFQASVTDPRFKLESQQGLGACFFRKGLFPLAARQFEAALQAAGGVAGERGKEICYHLGLVSERMNDRPGALARYLAVYEVDINFRDVARKIEDLKN
ncbi:MAG: hypothetical protein ACT4PU_08560 [Planctomycetota bacterium]